MQEAITFCRICLGQCGVVVSVDDNGAPIQVRGDKANPLTAGFACGKGVDSAEMHTRPDRILRPIKRNADGSTEVMALDRALDEIAERLTRIIDQDGPDAVALYSGTASYFNTALFKVMTPFMRAIGSTRRFSPLTIDSSSMVVRAARMGVWGAGKQRFDTADVWMMFGVNPIVSPRSNGVPPFNPSRKVKDAKGRGMQLIVIDPRQSDVARHADQFLQVKPGNDAALAGAMLNVILSENLHDSDFCVDHVEGMDRLKTVIAALTPAFAAERTGISAEEIVRAARTFATAGRGCADIGTGITMQAFSNLADHLVELLNVVCGRYLRAGEEYSNPGPFGPRREVHAEVVRPPRWWETGPRLNAAPYGMLFTDDGGEFPTTALPDEILYKGDGRIRALLSIGGNPAVAVPDQQRVVDAFRHLDLLVSVEPFPTPTARLSHYVIPPKLMYERADLPILFGQSTRLPVPFAQVTAAVSRPPAGSEVVAEWRFFWELARRMGKQLDLGGWVLPTDVPPSDDDIFDFMTRDAQVPLDEVRGHPHGHVFDLSQQVQPSRPGNHTRFDVMPDDVAEELDRYLHSAESGRYTHRLTVRRLRQACNSLVSAPDKLSPKKRFNPAYLNPADMAALGLANGDRVEIEGDGRRLVGIAEADPTVRTGVVSMSHSWGGLPDEPEDPFGAACTALLVRGDVRETINAMPAMTAIGVNLRPVVTR